MKLSISRGGLWAACLIVVLKLQALSGFANACVNGSHGLGLGEMVAGEGVEAELEVETILTARAQCPCTSYSHPTLSRAASTP